MPKASISNENVRYDLKTCPDGFVELRKMNYGQKLKRNQIAMDMTVKQGGKGKDAEASIGIMQVEVALFEYRICVVEHNLFEDDAETIALNFKDSKVLDILDPRVGDEIGKYIDEMNNFDEEDDDLGN